MISFKPVIYEGNFDEPIFYSNPVKHRFQFDQPTSIIYEAPFEDQEELPVKEERSQQKVRDDSRLSFEDLLKLEGIKVRVTSRFRPGAMTASGHHSNHSKKDEYGVSKAIDIVPEDGNFERLATQIYSNPRIVSWLQHRGYGILEEITPEIMRKTKATGKHFHVGPDKAAVLMTLNRLRSYA